MTGAGLMVLAFVLALVLAAGQPAYLFPYVAGVATLLVGVGAYLALRSIFTVERPGGRS